MDLSKMQSTNNEEGAAGQMNRTAQEQEKMFQKNKNPGRMDKTVQNMARKADTKVKKPDRDSSEDREEEY